MSLPKDSGENKLDSQPEENVFESQHGVQFQLIQPSMYAAVLDFMWEHFMPEEPLERSLSMTRCWLLDSHFGDAMKSGCSIAAIKDNKIIGVRTAKVVNRSDWLDWLHDRVLAFLFSLRMITYWLPNYLQGVPTYVKLVDRLNFDVWKQIDQLKCDRMLLGYSVCSARFHGIRGLGTELIKRSEAVGRERGCRYVYLSATGIYSTRIFNKLLYTVVSSLAYDEFRDDKGELYLKDTREHTHCTVFLKAL